MRKKAIMSNLYHDPQRIHLVPGNQLRPAEREREASEDSASANNRIEIGEYIADILVDKRSYPTLVHWIIQRRGCPEILQWGHQDTYDEASREATAWIDAHLRYEESRKELRR
jgi:hypothetical protein